MRRLSRIAAVRVVGAAIIAWAMAPAGTANASDMAPSVNSDLTIDGRPSNTQALPPELLDAIWLWLETEFELLPIPEHQPKVIFVPPERLVAMRYGRFATAPSTQAEHSNQPEPDIVALYHDASETIYLLEGWSGRTPAELSILVHELVHHAQNMGGQRFACPEEREKFAFEAQQRWLESFGQSLESASGIDPLTLLVRTTCFN